MNGKLYQIKCNECPYYWRDEEDEYHRCHYDSAQWIDDKAPCEWDEEYDEEY